MSALNGRRTFRIGKGPDHSRDRFPSTLRPAKICPTNTFAPQCKKLNLSFHHNSRDNLLINCLQNKCPRKEANADRYPAVLLWLQSRKDALLRKDWLGAGGGDGREIGSQRVYAIGQEQRTGGETHREHHLVRALGRSFHWFLRANVWDGGYIAIDAVNKLFHQEWVISVFRILWFYHLPVIVVQPQKTCLVLPPRSWRWDTLLGEQ